MGFMDKLKTATNNATNRIGQGMDSAKFDSKISDQKSAKTKAIREAGDIIFAAYCEGQNTIPAEAVELFENAKACDVEIAKLEEEKAAMIADAEKQRQANNDDLAALEAKQKAEAEAKAAEKKE